MKNIPYNLQGLRVLNTRPKGQNKQLTSAIAQALGESIELPVITIIPTSEAWLKTLPSLDKITYAIFVSTNGVHYFFNTLKRNKIKWPRKIQTIAIGSATASALAHHEIKVAVTPATADSEHLVQLQLFNNAAKQTILLVTGVGGRETIREYLLSQGASLTTVEVYRRKIPTYEQEFLASFWQEDRVDIILFTSEQSITNLFTLFGSAAQDWLCNKPCVVISTRLAKRAQQLGFKHIIVGTYDTIIAALASFNKGLTNDLKRLK